MTELVGQVLGQYQIVEQIGEGGMATVYKAYQSKLDRHVAIKVLTGANAADPDFRERFVREAKAVAQLAHTNILQVYDFGEDGELDVVYFVTQIVEGGSLTERMRQPIPLAEAARIITEVAGALDFAHSRGIIHRDIKPDNILLTSDGHALLTDFGVAQLMHDATGGGVQAGTPEYMAPEQARGDTVDHRADIYALGVMFYQLLTGHVPFEDEDPLRVLYCQVHDAPVPPSKRVSGVSSALEQVVMRALEKKPAARWPTAAAMARALELAMQQRGTFAAGQTTVASEGPRRKTAEWDVAAAQRIVSRPSWGTRVRSGLGHTGRAIKWIAVTALRIVAVLLVLAIVLAVVGLVGGSYYAAGILEQAMTSTDWRLNDVTPPADMMMPKSALDNALKANLIQIPPQYEIKDAWVELRPPDQIQFVAIQREWMHVLSGRLWAENGAPQVRLEDLDGVPLSMVGDVLSSGINRGLRAGWERLPVVIEKLDMTNDRVNVRLIESPKLIADPTAVALAFAKTATAIAALGGEEATPSGGLRATATLKPTSTLQPSPTQTATSTSTPTQSPTPMATPTAAGTVKSPTPRATQSTPATSGPEPSGVTLFDPPVNTTHRSPNVTFRWSGGALQGGEYFVVEILPAQAEVGGSCTGDYSAGGIQFSGPVTAHEWTTNIKAWRGGGRYAPCPGLIDWRVHIKDAKGANVQSTPLSHFTWNELAAETAIPKPTPTTNPRKIIPVSPLGGTTVRDQAISFKWTGGELNPGEYYIVEVIPDQVNNSGCTGDYNPSKGRQWSGPLTVQEWSLNLAASRPPGLYNACSGVVAWIVRTYNAAGGVVNTMPTVSFVWNPL